MGKGILKFVIHQYMMETDAERERGEKLMCTRVRANDGGSGGGGAAECGKYGRDPHRGINNAARKIHNNGGVHDGQDARDLILFACAKQPTHRCDVLWWKKEKLVL